MSKLDDLLDVSSYWYDYHIELTYFIRGNGETVLKGSSSCRVALFIYGFITTEFVLGTLEDALKHMNESAEETVIGAVYSHEVRAIGFTSVFRAAHYISLMKGALPMFRFVNLLHPLPVAKEIVFASEDGAQFDII